MIYWSVTLTFEHGEIRFTNHTDLGPWHVVGSAEAFATSIQFTTDTLFGPLNNISIDKVHGK